MRYLLLAAVLIPLKSIYSTSKQDGLGRAEISKTDGKTYVDLFGRSKVELRRGESKTAASNIFLVEAKDFDDAWKATRIVMTGNRRAERSARAVDEQPSWTYWFVAYFGSGHSQPPAWEVDSVSVDGNRIRLAYHTAGKGRKGMGATGDVWHYFYWIPLGKLEPGKYQLELFDGDAVTLMRLVEVR